MPDDLKSLYQQAYFVRRFEEALAKAYDEGEVPGLLHLCSGAEVAEALLCQALDSARDQVTGSHRGHGLALLMGADPEKLAKEILGRVGGLSNGMGGTQHIIAPETGFLTSNGIVGAQVPLALGSALSAKNKANGGIGVAVFGDGAANQGAVLESLNLAAALSLPVVFFLENNGVAQSTHSSYAAPGSSFKGRAETFGLVSFTLNTGDVNAAQATMKQAVKTARTGRPVFIEAQTARLSGHFHGDATNRTHPNSDPLFKLRNKLVSVGENERTIAELEDGVIERCNTLVENAATAQTASLDDSAYACREAGA